MTKNPQNNNRRRALFIIRVALALFAGTLLHAAAVSAEKEPSHLAIGYTGSAFQEATNTDIRAAVGVLVQKVAWKYFSRGETRFYETLADMAEDLRNRKVQVLATPIEEFMELRKLAPIDPILVSVSGNGPGTELLLLVRKDSGIRSLRALRSRSIVMPPRNPRCCSLFQAWIENMLAEERCGGVEAFFSTVKESRTIANGVMQVFFRQADACVVTQEVLAMTSELNPQIGRELVTIAHMDKLGQGIIALDRRIPEETRERIKQSFLSLYQTPEGEQLLMLFKVRRLIPFPSGYLKATEALYARRAKNESRRNH
ncbi:MAG TPA: PhnD/SsuA/transferrin family substrate-binding protein [Geobacteraceae bacterium]